MKVGRILTWFTLGLFALAIPLWAEMPSPAKIGDFVYGTVLETPHPYPGSPTGQPEMVWSDHFSYAGAKYIVFTFDRFDLGPGDWLEIQDANGKVIQTYEGKGLNNSGGGFVSKMVSGEEALLFLYSTNRQVKNYGYRIERISRGYSDEELALLYGESDDGGSRSDCGANDKKDAICYQATLPGEYNTGRAVARLLQSGTILCTAWLLSCQNHVITNHHCALDGDYDSQADLNQMEYQFGYEDTTCGGGGAVVQYSFVGGTYLQTDVNLDYTLITAPSGQNPQATWGYIAIDPREVAIGELMYLAGHPDGRPKEFSLESTMTADAGFAHVQSITMAPCIGGTHQELGYFADTEGGNSGSPVIQRPSLKAIGLHHCGTGGAACTSTVMNSGMKIIDVYTKIQSNADPAKRLPACSLSYSLGTVALDKDVYGCASTATITVQDGDLIGAGTQDVTVWSTTQPAPMTKTLTETPADSGTFVGTVVLTTTNPPPAGQLRVANGDTVSVEYIDADDGNGNTNVPRTDTALVDCAGPVITNVAAVVSGAQADVTWTTNEPANSLVTYGTAVPPGTNQSDLTHFVTSHSIHLSGLQPCTPYFFSVTSADPAGNSATANNGGAFYTFTTGQNVNPTYVYAGAPVPINDSSTINVPIVVPDNKIIQDVNVIINDIQHTFDGDLDIYLVAPDATQVELSTDNGSSGENYIDCILDDAAAASITTAVAPMTGTWKPEGLLSALNGKNAQGTWNLRITDDAGGDTGTLNSWSIQLLYPGQACGPHATYQSSTIQDDCPAGGPGDADGYIDPGETITLPLTVYNDGTVTLHNVVATISSADPNVAILNASTTFGTINFDTTAPSIAPHVSFTTFGGNCGDTLQFDVSIAATEGGPWTGTFTLVLGHVVAGGQIPVFSENFAGVTPPALPAGWTTQTLNSGNTWNTYNTYACSSPNNLSFKYNTSYPADSWAYTPGIALQAGVTYTLNYNERIWTTSWPEIMSIYAGTAAVNTSMNILIQDTTTFTNTTCAPQAPTFTVPADGTYYVGFHCTSATNMGYLTVDDINLTYEEAPSCTLNTCVNPACILTCGATAAPTSGNFPLTVNFTGSHTAAGCFQTPVYSWNFGDGTPSSNLQSPSHIYTLPGTYTWTLNVVADGHVCTQTGTITVINPCVLTCAPTAVPDTGNFPLTVQFSANITTTSCTQAPIYEWNFGDGSPSSNVANPLHSYPLPGTYTWTFSVTTDWRICTATGTVTVINPCVLTCTASAVPATGAVPLSVMFFANVIPSQCNPPVYDWNFGDGTAHSALPNPTHVYNTVGTFTWTLTVTTDWRTCTKTGTITVTPPCTLTCTGSAAPASGNGPLTVNFTATATTSFCAGLVTYAWTFGDGGTSTAQNPTHVYNPATSTTFTWTLTVKIGGQQCVKTGQISVAVYDVNIFDDRGMARLCVNTNSGNWKYQVLSGIGVGTYTGPGTVKLLGGVMYINSLPGAPWTLIAKYYPNYKKATASFIYRARNVNSRLTDSNTTNNPPGC